MTTTQRIAVADRDRQPELVFCRRPRCPDCDSPRLLCYKTTRGDGRPTTPPVQGTAPTKNAPSGMGNNRPD